MRSWRYLMAQTIDLMILATSFSLNSFPLFFKHSYRDPYSICSNIIYTLSFSLITPNILTIFG